MDDQTTFDAGIVGGGIVGCATAMALADRGLRVVVLEAEEALARHQTGNNSGVIHSGLYYRPGSLKAENCAAGRELMYRFCAEEGIACERCGKLVVATRPEELASLDELERRGLANGLAGLRRVSPEEIREREPHAAGLAGLLVPETGIVDYAAVTRAFARLVRERGGEIRTGARVRRVLFEAGGLVLETGAGIARARLLINCAGLQSDRVARICGVDPGVRIVPFRGEYLELREERRGLVNSLIYPVPDPRFPFLGVHFTRMIHGGVEAGPNAVLALAREGYSWGAISPRDVLSYLTYGGFWKMALRFWRVGLGEIRRSWSRRAMLRALRRLLPELELADLGRGGAGVRAQALAPDGRMVDDFHIVEAPRMIHVLNAPSPAATASIAVGRHIAALVERHLG
jgi:L-2-hydroxyglutarate oxidase